MGTPQAVKKAGEKADQLQQDHIKALAGEQPVDPNVKVETPGGAPVEKQPAPKEKTAAPAAADGEFKKRYDNLKAKWDRTVPQLREDNESLKGELGTLSDQVGELRALIEKNEAQPVKTTQAPPDIEISDEEIEEYGPELIELMTRIAYAKGGEQKDVAKQLLELQKDVQSIKDGQKTVVKRQAQTEQTRFLADLLKLVPDWKVVNETADFKDWLGLDMPGTRQEYQYFLDEAAARFDHEAVAQIFLAYKGGGSKAPTSDSADDDNDVAGDLEDSILPNGSKASTVQTEDAGGKGKTIWTGKMMAKFYRDVQDGKYVGKEDEQRRIEIDIHAANAEGRVK